MSQAARDENRIPTLLGVSTIDFSTPTTAAVNPTTHALLVSGTAVDGAILDGASASIKATVFDYTNSNPLAVRLTDTNGDNLSTFTSIGSIAHDSPDSGNPVKVGFKAFSPDGTTPGTAVTENDRTDGKADLDGRQFVNTRHARWWSYHSDGSSALTDASVQADPGDGFEIVITEIIVSTGAATAMNVFFEEGSTKILGPWYLEAVAGRGVFWKGEKHVTPSTAVTVTTSAAIAQSIDVQGYIQAV